ncbi:MAG TPA: phenylpyruvate tautomerase MIF-related protein, partial [Candidatus Obscuribacterales bacterium]
GRQGEQGRQGRQGEQGSRGSKLLPITHYLLPITHYRLINMPLIQVKTSIAQPQKSEVESLLKSLSSALAKQLGKPESYVMTAFESDIPMTFAGSTDPVCYIEIKSVGTMQPNQTKAMSQEFCEKISQALGVPQNRIYIEFADAKGLMWGWNGSTFG